MRTYRRPKPCRNGHTGLFSDATGRCVDCQAINRFRLRPEPGFDFIYIVNFPVSRLDQIRDFVLALAAPGTDPDTRFQTLTPQTGTHTTIAARAHYDFVRAVHQFAQAMKSEDPGRLP